MSGTGSGSRPSKPNPAPPPAPGPDPPPAGLWQGPLSWTGTPPRPVEDYSRAFPADAAFVRGELVITLAEPAGPDATRQAVRAVPALIRLERGEPVEVHAPGLDGRCWTYRPSRVGRKVRWGLYAGPSFPAVEPVGPPEAGSAAIERVVVQSVLPGAASGRPVSFAIRDDGGVEDHSRAVDPDPDD